MRRILLTAVALIAVACSPSEAARPSWPPDPQRVEVVLDEYRFDFAPDISAGRVVFEVRNSGDLVHELQFFELPDDFPPIDEQIRGSERRVLAATGGVPSRQPGGSGSFAVDLVAGQRYALVCLLQDEDGSHGAKGMNAEFTAADPSGEQGVERPNLDEVVPEAEAGR